MRGTFQLMKSVNKRTILNKIRLMGPISRADIAKETGITPPTVTNLVKELIKKDLVEESHLGNSSGGRKPTLLQLKADGCYVIGVDAGSKSIEAALFNMIGTPIRRAEKFISKSVTTKEFINIMIEVLHQILDQTKISSEKIVGIGVAMHGVMNIEEGVSYYSSNSGLKNVPIKEKLEEEFKHPVLLENNSRALTLGEFWFGNYEDTSRFAAINIGRGVGSGLIVNNKLIHGSQFLAGEIGHTTIDFAGEICSCGNRGCLETFISGGGIARRAKKQIKNASVDLKAEDVYYLAVAGEHEYVKILEETGYFISIGILNLINTVNPNTIILSGGVMRSEEFLMPIIRQNIYNRILTNTAQQEIKISVGKLEDEATLLGAAALWLNRIFYS